VHARLPKSVDELRHFAFEEWENLNKKPEYFNSLVDSMPNRLEAIMARNGYYTKY
jgi:hypothetical protein